MESEYPFADNVNMCSISILSKVFLDNGFVEMGKFCEVDAQPINQKFKEQRRRSLAAYVMGLNYLVQRIAILEKSIHGSHCSRISR